MVDLVELAVLGQGVAKVDTDGLVDLANGLLLCRVCHSLLNELEALRVVLVLDVAHVRMGVNIVLGQIYACLGCQLRGTSLAEVHVGDASVSTLGPRVSGRFWVQIQLDVAELVDPAEEVAVLVGIARPLATTHRDAQDIPGLDPGHCSERGDFTVVDDLERDIPCYLLGKAPEDAYHLLLVHVLGHIREDVAPRGPIVR
mmetsp:Transcript_18640/g.40722  ORF Transcript_18640/g.40722 Transcript_18640/m.40722 type:complete len:200 (+) Transcript_18640:355-954(+)